MHETRSLWKLSDQFAFEVELNSVEIQDQRCPNGSIPRRMLYIHQVEPDVKSPTVVFDPKFF